MGTASIGEISARQIRLATKLIAKIDLSKIAAKVRTQKGWTKRRLEQAVLDYREFLLSIKTTDGVHEPERDVDEIWHMHILDTRQYASDCENVFGKFIHHCPTYREIDRTKKTADCGACRGD